MDCITEGRNFFLCLLLLIISFEKALSSRPNCPCMADTRTQTVNCSNQQLVSVPKCVPNDTKELILRYNNFKVLNLRQFQRFEYLKSLNLEHNSLQHLSNGSFLGLSELTSLYLGANMFRSWNISSLKGLSNLQTLDLHYNRIAHYRPNSFNTLSNLLSLDISWNRVKFLTKNTFNGLSSLKILILNYNLLSYSTSFPSDIFQPLTSLQELHINGLCRYDAHCSYIDKQLSKVPSLRRLYIDGLRNQTLGPGFASLRNLEELYFGEKDYIVSEYCKLGTINGKMFENLRNAPLRILHLKECDIQIVFPNTFVGFKNLTYLDVSGNFQLCQHGLKNLTQGIDATKIKTLNVSGTCTGTSKGWILVPWTFIGLLETELETLDLSDCSIRMGMYSIFRGLPKSLKHLYLQNNNFNKMLFEGLNILQNLLSIDLSHQTQPMLSAQHFQEGQPKQFVVNDTINQLQTFIKPKTNYNYMTSMRNVTESKISIARSAAVEYDFKETKDNNIDGCINRRRKCWNLHSLQSIDISYSSLVYDMPSLCDSNTNNLNKLDVSHQQQIFCPHLHSFEIFWRDMKKLRMLKELDMSYMGLKDIPKDAFSQQFSLKRLSISGNSLVDIDFKVSSLQQLQILDLSENNIQFISRQFTNAIEEIAKHSNLTLFLDNNRLVCDCDRLDFVSWLRHTQVIFQKERLTCSYRNGSSVSLSRISEIHFLLKIECMATLVLICCIVGFWGLILILSLANVVYYKRWQFRYLLSVGRRNINPYHPLEDETVEMENDVYISYDGDYDFTSDQSLHEFVAKTLHPELRARGFKVLIREELDVGMKLYELISRAIRKSKKIVILLTDHYCDDSWNVFEFNIAVMEGIYTKRQTVIPVLLETVNPENLHEEIYALLKTEQVPMYSNDMNPNLLIEYLSDIIRD